MTKRFATLDAEALAELGRPFSPAAVKYKPLTKPGSDNKAGSAFYIDARLVAERLNAIVGPEGWQDEYKPLLATGAEMAGNFFPVECALTVLGFRKIDVGCYQRNAADDKAWKAAYSDAFKRVAVKFRVGAYLYAIPRLRAEVKTNQQGKVTGFSDAGKKYLDTAYLRWLDNPTVNTFGDPLDHGDAVLPDDQAAGEDASIEFPAPTASAAA